MLDKRKFYINGAWVAPREGRDLEVIDPSTEEPFAVISLGGAADAEAAIAAAKAGNQPITQRHLPAALADPDGKAAPSLPTLADVERAHIAEVMVRTGGVRSRAAQVLGIASSTLYEKLKKYGIE